MEKIKIIPLLLIVILVVNLVLFALGKIDQIYFWVLIGVIGLYAYRTKIFKK